MGQPLFDTTLTPAALTAVADNRLVLVLGATTIIYLTSTQPTTTIISLTASGGNADGQVVCLCNINAASRSIVFTNESLTETVVTARFRSNSPITIVQYGAVWYRWSTTSQRWQTLSKV